MFSVTWDLIPVITGMLLLPFPGVLAIQQYRGTFRYSASAASTSSTLLFIVGGFALFVFAATLREMVVVEVRIRWMYLSPMLAVGIVSWAAAFVNKTWSRRLRHSAAVNGQSANCIRFSMRELLIAVTVIACMSALVGRLVRTSRYAEHVTLDKAPFNLPAHASNISYCQGVSGSIAYEFSIDEESFLEWIEERIGSRESKAANFALKRIKAPYTIRRYGCLSWKLRDPHSITITKGLFCEWSKEGRSVCAAFDRTTHRAYYFAQFQRR